MGRRLQSTRLQISVGRTVERLDHWAINPWRRYSLLAIAGLGGFFLGSAITSVAGVLGQMDPVAALIVVLGTELTVRRTRSDASEWKVPQQMLDLSRIGFLYGLFLEAFSCFKQAPGMRACSRDTDKQALNSYPLGRIENASQWRLITTS